MAEPRQFSAVFAGNVGASIQATDSATTVIAAAATPVIAGNAFGQIGSAFQVIVNANNLEADHTSGGARLYGINFNGRVAKLAGSPGNVNVHVYLNGAPLTNPAFRMVECWPGDPASEFSMNISEQLVDGDVVALYLENVDDDEDLALIEGATLSITS